MILKGNNFKKIKLTNIYLFVFLFLLIIQLFFWLKNKNLRAKLDIVTYPPNEKIMKAFGDDEFFYRFKSFQLQNMGDTLGRFSALRNYDYKKLYYWFVELEKLDYESNSLPSMVAYYYSQTPNIEDKRYVVKFLIQHSLRNVRKKWWWLYQASYLANYEIKDKDLALRIAYLIQKLAPDNAPFWVKQTYSIYLSQIGKHCESIRVINEILKNLDIVKDEKEINYMKFFIESESKKITKEEFFNCMNVKSI